MKKFLVLTVISLVCLYGIGHCLKSSVDNHFNQIRYEVSKNVETK